MPSTPSIEPANEAPVGAQLAALLAQNNLQRDRERADDLQNSRIRDLETKVTDQATQLAEQRVHHSKVVESLAEVGLDIAANTQELQDIKQTMVQVLGEVQKTNGSVKDLKAWRESKDPLDVKQSEDIATISGALVEISKLHTGCPKGEIPVLKREITDLKSEIQNASVSNDQKFSDVHTKIDSVNLNLETLKTGEIAKLTSDIKILKEAQDNIQTDLVGIKEVTDELKAILLKVKHFYTKISIFFRFLSKIIDLISKAVRIILEYKKIFTVISLVSWFLYTMLITPAGEREAKLLEFLKKLSDLF